MFFKILKLKVFIIFLFVSAFTYGDTDNSRNVQYNNFKKIHNNYYVIPPKDKNSLRLVTWNVRKFVGLEKTNDLENVVKSIQNFDADVVALQEVYQNYEITDIKEKQYQELNHDWIKQLSVEKNFNIIKCHSNNIAQSLEQQAIAVLTSLEVIESKCYVFPDELQHPVWHDSKLAFQKIKVKFYNDVINIINLHIDPMDSTGQIRKKQLEIVLQELRKSKDEKKPTIIMGDFNSINYRQVADNEQLPIILHQDIKRQAPTALYEHELLYAAGFKEAFDFIDAKAPYVSVWSMRKVDFVYYNAVQPLLLKPYVIPWVYSDHLPIMVDSYY